MSSSDRSLWTLVGKLTSIATSFGYWKFFQTKNSYILFAKFDYKGSRPVTFFWFVNRIFEESLQIDIFLTPRGNVEAHNMRLNHIENMFHAKFYINQLFRKRNLIGYIKNLIGNIYEKTHLSHFLHNLLTNYCLIYGFVSFEWLMVDF